MGSLEGWVITRTRGIHHMNSVGGCVRIMAGVRHHLVSLGGLVRIMRDITLVVWEVG